MLTQQVLIASFPVCIVPHLCILQEDSRYVARCNPAQEAVEAVIGILGMQPCEGSEAVPPNARSHTVLSAGIFVGYQQVSSFEALR